MKIRLPLLALVDLRASCFATLWGMLAMGLGVMAWPGEALAWTGQPLVYVTSSDGISVIDTGDNKVVDTIPGFASPTAVAPDGKHVYAFGPAASDLVFNISVIDATNDKVVATIPLDVSQVYGGVSLNANSSGIAVTPDGKHIFATTGLCSSNSFSCNTPGSVYFAVWEIDSATNKALGGSAGKGIADGVAFTPDGQHSYLTNFDSYYGGFSNVLFENGGSISLPYFSSVYAIAITPDGRHAYVPYFFYSSDPWSENVAIIDTATNMVVKTVLVETTSVETTLRGVAVTPDGKYVYVTTGSNSAVVIDTASNTIVKTIPVGTTPTGLAVTPDGKHVYVTNQGSNSVSVIDAASNSVVATVPVAGPTAISIIPPPQGVQFLSFNAKVDINLGSKPNRGAFDLGSSFILNSTAGNGIHPDTEAVKLQVGPFIATMPAGSFRRRGDRSYTFEGVINDVRLEARIELRGGFSYAFHAEAKGANLSGTTNPTQVSLAIGDDAALTSVKAHFNRDHQAIIGRIIGVDR
jgi:YVTN family beta-propeller protein